MKFLTKQTCETGQWKNDISRIFKDIHFVNFFLWSRKIAYSLFPKWQIFSLLHQSIKYFNHCATGSILINILMRILICFSYIFIIQGWLREDSRDLEGMADLGPCLRKLYHFMSWILFAKIRNVLRSLISFGLILEALKTLQVWRQE